MKGTCVICGGQFIEDKESQIILQVCVGDNKETILKITDSVLVHACENGDSELNGKDLSVKLIRMLANVVEEMPNFKRQT